MSRYITTGMVIETPSLEELPTKGKEFPLPMRQTIPCWTPTRNFMVSGGANRYYTLLKGDLEVGAPKGNLIIPHQELHNRMQFYALPRTNYYYYCLIAPAQAVLIADIFLIGRLQQVAKDQEGAFTLHV